MENTQEVFLKINQSLSLNYGVLGAVILQFLVVAGLFLYIFKKIIYNTQKSNYKELDKLENLSEQLKIVSENLEKTARSLENINKYIVDQLIYKKNKLKSKEIEK